jgi:hypothetical protein
MSRRIEERPARLAVRYDHMVSRPARAAAWYAAALTFGLLLIMAVLWGRGVSPWLLAGGLVALTLLASGAVGLAVHFYQLARYNELAGAVEVVEETREPEPRQAAAFAMEVKGATAKLWTRIPPEPRPGALQQFAARVTAGASFSLRTAEEAGYSRSAWVKLRDSAVANGWAYWRDERHPEQGLMLTVPGLRWIEELSGGRAIPNNNL